jgi:hypothetical protein
LYWLRVTTPGTAWPMGSSMVVAPVAATTVKSVGGASCPGAGSREVAKTPMTKV